MKRKRVNTGMWNYLESSGALQSTDDVITAARKKYRQEYKRNWRKNYRKTNKELTLTLSYSEWELVTKAAQMHKRSRTRFATEAAIAYIYKSFIIPNDLEVRRIKEILTMNYNALEVLIEKHPVAYFQSGNKLLNTFSSLEKEILTLLHNPKSLEELIVDVVRENASRKKSLVQFIESLS